MAEARDLCKNYQVGPEIVHALQHVDLEFEEGSYTAVMGHSGSGKSTLLNLLGCLDRPTSGHYFLGGQDVSQLDDNALSDIRGQHIGFVFQSFNLIAQLTVEENIELPLFYQGLPAHTRREKAIEMGRRVGLGDRLLHRPNELSGGQQQRVAIARSLVNDPLILLADEPTGNLDTATQKEIMAVFEGLNKQGRTIIMVTHEDDVAAWAQREIHLRDGRVDRVIER
ncbi:MAG: ATP-binding cassette domain-containing protein [Anaerolineaceae bacterium]|nr:ATP-binding cassette domain-containing protein [Anaerolineaceae bacterium]